MRLDMRLNLQPIEITGETRQAKVLKKSRYWINEVLDSKKVEPEIGTLKVIRILETHETFVVIRISEVSEIFHRSSHSDN